jgi:hypothetical protein
VRALNFAWIGLVLTVAVALFVLKYEVQSLEDSLIAKQAKVSEHEHSIQVLEAEWTFLTDPNRLRNLSAEHLELAPVLPSRIVKIDAIPFPVEQTTVAPEGEQ